MYRYGYTSLDNYFPKSRIFFEQITDGNLLVGLRHCLLFTERGGKKKKTLKLRKTPYAVVEYEGGTTAYQTDKLQL